MYAEPARQYIDQHGGAVRSGMPARVRVGAGGVDQVSAGGEEWQASAVIAAVPWYALPDLFEGDTAPLAPMLTNARNTAASPIVTVNLWFDRQVIDQPFIGLPGRLMQWLFDKRMVFGDSAAHLSLVSSGAPEVLAWTNPDLLARAHRELLDAVPAVGSARLLRGTVIREPRATFSLAPGQPPRPPTRTSIPGLYLAGDWVDTGLPATIEGAVRSGHAAAAAIAHR
jgi:predicted NAD/FAD-dependent oxidoreductase